VTPSSAGDAEPSDVGSARGPRRVPTQRRSRERLARILHAAGELCADGGLDALTMEAIAQRAGTSIGSLYQFFPNQDTLVAAVAQRYVADLEPLLAESDAAASDSAASHSAGAAPAPPIDALVDAVLEPFVRFHRTHPGYFAILFAPQGSAALARLRGGVRQRLVRRVETLLAERAPHLTPAKRRRLALTAVEAGRALLQYTEQSVPAGARRAMRTELRDMLVAYLAPWLERPGARQGAPAAERR